MNPRILFRRFITFSIGLLLVLPMTCVGGRIRTADAAPWAMYRGDASRSGYTADSLPDDLELSWTYRASHRPVPAWPRSERMRFDRAFQPVVAGGVVVFGSSVDGNVVAIGADDGEEKWTFATDGPIRFAPVAWKDRLFVASDDGHLYAIELATGKLLWNRRGGPDGRMILGNQRMISKWPARGGPVVVDDTVYFAAGIWPSDGIYLFALNALTGKVIWQNNDSGGINMPQPHGGANAASGVSSQGYLVASGDRLFVPTGRAVPASFDRLTGKFHYFHLQKYGHNGGTPTMAVGDFFFNSGLSFNSETGTKMSSIGQGDLASTPEGLVRASGKSVFFHPWVKTTKPDPKGNPIPVLTVGKPWTVAVPSVSYSLIVAGNTIVAGGEKHVSLIDRDEQQLSAKFEVPGDVYGMAASDGRLIISTSSGEVMCYAKKDPSAVAKDVSAKSAPDPTSPYGENTLAAAAAEEIIRKTGITAGYCFDFGCGDGALAYELVKRTELRIIAVDSDSKNVIQAREKLMSAGVYGDRVMVHRRDSAADYPRYFANLIVSGRSVLGEENLLSTAKLISTETRLRLQRPYGGVVCLGETGQMTVDTRGSLEGAGNWTHQYSNAANTLCSDDALVGGQLGMLWFRDVDFDVPQRHGRAPAPLVSDGRLFHEGLNGLCAVDAYNGRVLWTYEIPGVLRAYNGDELMGTAGTGSNFCVDGESVYVRHEKRCLRIDAATGKLVAELNAPNDANGKPRVWGYIAATEGRLYGSLANTEHVVTYRYVNRGGDMKKLLTESTAVFSIDPKSGKVNWQYNAKDSIRHNAIAISGGQVYVIDRPVASFDRNKRSTNRDHPTGKLVSINGDTGEVQWENDEDIYGTALAVSEKHKMLLMSYQPTRFRLASELGGRMAGLRTTDGKRRWDLKVNYKSRPMINDYTIYAEGGAWDLYNGEAKPFPFKRSYGCGVLAGSKDMMLFRSATLGYFNLRDEKGTQNFGGVRPGCWINAIPAGGIVLVPDASSGCQCSYLNKAWFALEPGVGPASIATGNEEKK
ncbi:MAG: outer membrane protein assembly factor BamB [Pirellulaceae bacterium]